MRILLIRIRDQQTACSAYLQYIQGQNSSLQQQISDAQSRKDAASEQLSSVQSQISDLNYQISEINSSIEDLNNQIAEAEQQSALIAQQISDTKVQIQQKTDDIAALKEKVKKRMEKQQETMRTNQILDVLLGAKSFSEMITIANGLSDISQYDSHTLQQLQDDGHCIEFSLCRPGFLSGSAFFCPVRSQQCFCCSECQSSCPEFGAEWHQLLESQQCFQLFLF